MPVKSKIAIFGGSFDPVHLGHVGLATESKSAIGLDKIIFLPCLKSPHKNNIPSASPDQRLEMLKIATKEHEWIDNVQHLSSEVYSRKAMSKTHNLQTCVSMAYIEDDKLIGVMEFYL